MGERWPTLREIIGVAVGIRFFISAAIGVIFTAQSLGASGYPLINRTQSFSGGSDFFGDHQVDFQERVSAPTGYSHCSKSHLDRSFLSPMYLLVLALVVMVGTSVKFPW